ncbi:hypothetical protein TSUD_160990 [Trifolium subterraneum]|uniref:RNase H type-1 domain-containing protein n=1 Tax=Trifolium subterraneum TaxID=3900 RepID=A0A2Z6MBI9_TRISU|nr:hypothetical protein TSUD_160990 [Trifolium subterraneum]
MSLVHVYSFAFDAHVVGTNQSSQQRLGLAASFGIIFGIFLKGFYGTATHSSVLYAEIMANLHGLDLCWVNGYRKIECYSDSLQAVALIRDGVSPHHQYANEIQSIRHLLRRDWIVAVIHTLREGNACADVLAKMGSSESSAQVVLDEPPPQLSSALHADALGVAFARD